MPKDSLLCKVLSVYPDKNYLVAIALDDKGLDDDDTITCNLAGWDYEIPPESQQIVELFRIRRFEKGWRAETAKPVVHGGL